MSNRLVLVLMILMLVMQGLAAILPASLPGRSTLLVGAAIIVGAAVFEIAERPLFATRRVLSRRMALWLDTFFAVRTRSKVNVN